MWGELDNLRISQPSELRNCSCSPFRPKGGVDKEPPHDKPRELTTNSPGQNHLKYNSCVDTGCN